MVRATGASRCGTALLIAALLVLVLAAGCGGAAAPRTATTTATHPFKPPTPAGSSGVADAVRSLRHANIAFNTPQRLRLHQSAQIELLLSPRSTLAALEQQLSQAGQRTGARVRFGDVMQAELQGAGFEITPIGDSKQAVDPEGVTRWQWEVAPSRTGVLHLHLTLSAFVSVDGQSQPYQVTTYDKDLRVTVTWTTQARDFLSGNWQWLWSAILLPVAAWLVRRRRRGAVPAGGDAVPGS